jgi:DNA polymerase-3 subunit epsilon
MDFKSLFRNPVTPLPRQPGAEAELEFAVVDVETTGLHPEGNDRIVEIAVIRLDGAGRKIDEYCSLVNPRRDLGPTHIHGISAREAVSAPAFEEIAGDVVARMAGAAVVGHNVQFDFRFVEAEYRRLGYALPDAVLLCTMHLAKSADPCLPGRKLAVCCKHFGIPLSNAHSAHYDADATAKLLTECLRRLTPAGSSFSVEPPPPRKDEWPAIPVSGKALTRTQAAARREQEVPFLAKMVARLPASRIPDPKVDEYLALLDRVLEDRRVTSDEADLLFQAARGLHLSKEQVIEAHKNYFGDLVRVAFADQVLTENEEKDLRQVKELLAVTQETYDQMLRDAQHIRASVAGAGSEHERSAHELVGKAVCFTGEFSCRINGQMVSREMAEKVSAERGLVVKKGVTKTLDILVAADPDSLSGKASKARSYGIRILAEPAFWRMIGVDFE